MDQKKSLWSPLGLVAALWDVTQSPPAELPWNQKFKVTLDAGYEAAVAQVIDQGQSSPWIEFTLDWFSAPNHKFPPDCVSRIS